MSQLRHLFLALGPRQRLSIIVVVALVCVGLLAVMMGRASNDYRVLYKDLAPEDAAAMDKKLKESNIEHRLSEDGTSILVPAEKLAESRLQLASAALPRSGRMGFDLFDKTNLTTTDFGEHVNYKRALEGELERSILFLAEVEKARVHITFPKESVFLENRQPAKASVLVGLRAGQSLDAANVQAITHLVASAVEGLGPESVALVDMHGRLLGKPRKAAGPDGVEGSDALIEFRQSLERDVLAKVNQTLEPVLGGERFRAGVSVDCDYSLQEVSEETFDPGRSVMVSSQKTEESTAGRDSAGGSPGIASNLPRPAPRQSAGGAGAGRKTENTTYQTSRSVKHTKVPRGTVKKISVAVLLDYDVKYQQVGQKTNKVLSAPPPEKVKIIRDLVAGVVGLDTGRGDLLTVESLAFEQTTMDDSSPGGKPSVKDEPVIPLPPWAIKIFGKGSIPMAVVIQNVVLIIVFIVILVLFQLFQRRGGTHKAPPGTVAGQAALPPGAEGAHPGPVTHSSSQIEGLIEAKISEQEAVRAQMEAEALSSLKIAPVGTTKTEVILKHLREEAKTDAKTTAQLIRSWLTQED